jgi:translation initiation factor 2 alpha subunit (eIF-2alpha)
MSYYRKEFPANDDIVFFRYLRTTEEQAVEVELVEYNNMRALIMPGELSKYKINPVKLLGSKIHPALVFKSDNIKKEIDLSYKRIKEQDREKLMYNFTYIDKIHVMGKDISQLYNIYLKKKKADNYIKICDNTIWDIFSDNKIEETEYDKLHQNILNNPLILFKSNKDLEDEFITRYMSNVQKRIKSTNIIMEKEFTLQVFTNAGIEKLRKILTEDLSSDIVVQCISAPNYKLLSISPDKADAVRLIEEASIIIINNNNKYGGVLNWKEPNIVKNKIYSIAPLKSYLIKF